MEVKKARNKFRLPRSFLLRVQQQLKIYSCVLPHNPFLYSYYLTNQTMTYIVSN